MTVEELASDIAVRRAGDVLTRLDYRHELRRHHLPESEAARLADLTDTEIDARGSDQTFRS